MSRKLIEDEELEDPTKRRVDVNQDFYMVSNFGRFHITELMQTYVFDGIFPALQEFFNQRLQMKKEERKAMKKLLKFSFMSIAYKSKPSHEKRIQSFVQTVRNIPQLAEIADEVNMDSMLGPQPTGEEAKPREQIMTISQAAKLKVLMDTCKTDRTKKKQVADEFGALVGCIINIDKRSEEAFRGANTIKVNDFIESLIKSSDVTSDISSELRTSSLTIIRKIIESENKNESVSGPSSEWETDDWDRYAPQIREAQDMLNRLHVVDLLCRIIEKETKRQILEEALLVAIAVLLGGNQTSQENFHAYIVKDVENAFLVKVQEMLAECFDLIKKTQVKRNSRASKIAELEEKLAELDEEEDEERFKKLDEQKRVLQDDIKDTDYVPDEDRIGEELTVSRAIDMITTILRFI